MSLIDALLLDGEPLDVWIAVRDDGVNGSGTEDDPFDGSTRNTPIITDIAINSSGTLATVQATGHGFQNGQLVLIDGATGADATYYNGTFAISGVTADSFQYRMWGAPAGSPAQGALSCRLDPYQFDAVMRAVPVKVTSLSKNGATATAVVYSHGFASGNRVEISGVSGPSAQYYNGTFAVAAVINYNAFSYTMSETPPDPPEGNSISCRLVQSGPVTGPLRRALPVSVRLGPGTFETRGWTPSALQTSWAPRTGMKVLGSGMEVTVLKLVQAMVDHNPDDYIAITGAYDNYLESFEASDFTVDCNLSGQPSPWVACGAVAIRGSHTLLRRIRAINFGTQTSAAECFVLSSGGPGVNCCTADCIAEQPSPNNARESSLINMLGDDGAYHRACVIRNCFVDCEFRENPVPIASISVDQYGVATVTTRLPHGRSNGDWVRISGAWLNGGTNNSFNGSYTITNVSTYGFKYTPNPSQPQTSIPSGDMWVGKFPSLLVKIVQISRSQEGSTNTWHITLTTLTPHFRVPGEKVTVGRIYDVAHLNPPVPSPVYNGWFEVVGVDGPKTLRYDIVSESPPNFVQIGPSGQASWAHLGTDFHGLGADLGTGAVVEGNRVLNCNTGGPYHDTYNTRDQVTRNNYYRVMIGPYQSLQGVGPEWPLTSLTSSLKGGLYVATATSPGHKLSAGEVVLITGVTPNAYNGYFVITTPPDATTFKYTLGPNAPGTPTVLGSCARVWGGGRQVLENNIIEIFAARTHFYSPTGIAMGWSAPGVPTIRTPEAVARRNVIRHVDGTPDPEELANLSRGMFVSAVGALMVEENVVDLDITTPPIEYADVRSPHFFANQNAAGELIQGSVSGTGVKAGELWTLVEDAEALVL